MGIGPYCSYHENGLRSMIERTTSHSVNLLGIHIDDLPVETLVKQITEYAYQRQKVIVANVNIHAMNLAYEQSDFHDFLNGCELVFCDGVGVKLGARLLGQNIQYRYTPPDWVPLLCQACVRKNLSMYFLGAKAGIAQQAADKLQALIPGLKIVGTSHGHFDKTPSSIENQAVLDEINGKNPDILLVGFGMPLQEFWLRDNWANLNTYVALPVGAFFDYTAEAIRRAPAWVTDHGFEWLGRLLIEPGRLWERYIIGNPRFFWRILKYSLDH
jgi:N-acetylglucosaminyldiphosphoundecaprenol N-acetyl-beta-D-mannosaminyltransferase